MEQLIVFHQLSLREYRFFVIADLQLRLGHGLTSIRSTTIDCSDFGNFVGVMFELISGLIALRLQLLVELPTIMSMIMSLIITCGSRNSQFAIVEVTFSPLKTNDV
ncbi:unnamed protein product [Acanthocheilonema viteae]|uniref:Uncharacterized protein n=1 Tax=Acanthocheilonema viteae TaxID=6277 RepID=A0A498STE6_ACAVI|nr:unnamed protein product [Acanthocheilonema viteae]